MASTGFFKWSFLSIFVLAGASLSLSTLLLWYIPSRTSDIFIPSCITGNILSSMDASSLFIPYLECFLLIFLSLMIWWATVPSKLSGSATVRWITDWFWPELLSLCSTDKFKYLSNAWYKGISLFSCPMIWMLSCWFWFILSFLRGVVV